MNKNIAVIKSSWRKIQRPSAETLAKIAMMDMRVQLAYVRLLVAILRTIER